MSFVQVGQDWRCPYCERHLILAAEDIDDNERPFLLNWASDKNFVARLQTVACRNCRGFTSTLSLDRLQTDTGGGVLRDPANPGRLIRNHTYRHLMIHPLSDAPKFESKIVPTVVLADFEEAHAVKDASPRAAAVLARRVVQSVLRDFYGVKPKRGDLRVEIDAAKEQLGTALYDAITAVRILGNIGAHPERDVDLFVDVSRDEVGVALDVIQYLIANTYVKRADDAALLERARVIGAAKNDQKLREAADK